MVPPVSATIAVAAFASAREKCLPAMGAIEGPEPTEWMGASASSPASITPPLDVSIKSRPPKPAAFSLSCKPPM